MTTSISPATSLATFSIPHASSSKLPHVTLNTVEVLSGKQGSQRLAVAAVQGDGVWTYDLSTLRPTTSYTVPPSTVFSTRPISFVSSRAKAKQRSQDDSTAMDVDAPAITDAQQDGPQRCTAVGVLRGEGVEKKNEGKVVWCWTGEDGVEKQRVTLPHTIAALHHIRHPDHPILAVHSPNYLSLLDADLAVQLIEVSNVPTKFSKVITTQILSSSQDHARLAILDDKGSFFVIAVDLKGENPSARCNITGRICSNERAIMSGSISPEGVITAVDGQNNLLSRNIKDQSPFPDSYPRLIHPSPLPALLSLPTVGKPLTVIPTNHPTPSVLLIIPSPTLPALLTSSAISSFSASGSISHLALLGVTSPGTLAVGVVLTHSSANGGGTGEEGGRSVIYVMEISIPEKGVGMNALLGSQSRTEKYISSSGPSSASSSGSTAATVSALEQSCSEVFDDLKQGDVKSACAKWREWIKLADKESAASASTGGPGGKAVLPEAFVKKLVTVILSTALPATANSDGDATQVVTARSTPAKGKQRAYASELMSSLLRRRVVGDEMWPGGVVVNGLLPLNDWENILLSLPFLPTLSPSALVQLLKSAIHAPVSSNAPSLEKLLEVILGLPTPAPSYRHELQRGLTVEDATAVLEVMVKWAEMWVEYGGKGLQWDVKLGDEETAEETPVLSDAMPSPSLESVLTHSSLLLDAHTLSFLSHPPSHPLLGRLQAALEPLLLLQADYRALRAPLEAVLTLARREERRQQERARKREVLAGALNGGSGSGAGAGGGKNLQKGGLGTRGRMMGDEKVGKWKVEDFVF